MFKLPEKGDLYIKRFVLSVLILLRLTPFWLEKTSKLRRSRHNGRNSAVHFVQLNWTGQYQSVYSTISSLLRIYRGLLLHLGVVNINININQRVSENPLWLVLTPSNVD